MTKALINTKTVVLLAIIFSVVAFWLSYTNNYILTYNDAASHLNIARRIVDNIQPGLAQIGTVWLPLPHVAMLPLAWNDYLWHTGFAGSFVSMVAFVTAITFMYKTIFAITKSTVGGLIGALVMLCNPNLLYLQTTPMTEPLLVATFCAAIYFLARYILDYRVQDLLFCSVAVMCATLIRYDGWFLFMSLLVLLPLWIIFFKNRARAEGTFLLFATMGGFGIFAWVLWNYSIFGDPLYFAFGPYSAYAQQRVLDSVGQLPTEGSVYNALYYYLWAMIDNVGMVIFSAGVAAAFMVPFVVKEHRTLIVYMAAFTPILFNTIALYMGQSAMNVPQAPHDPGMFNIRYGLMALPFLALCIGTLSSSRILAVIAVVIIAVQSLLFYRE